MRLLDKSPATTFVVIDEVALEDRGVGGVPVEEVRRRNRPSAPDASSGPG